MEISLVLKGVQPITLPLAYHRLVQGMIYNALQTAPGYSKFIHDSGYNTGSRHFKLFVFSSLNGKKTIVNNCLVFHDKIYLDIRSADTKFIQALLISFCQAGSVTLAESEATILKCELHNTILYEEEYQIKMRSPITAYCTTESKKTVYYSPFDTAFVPSLRQNFASKYEAFYGKTPNGTISLVPTAFDVKKDKYVTNYKGFYITAWRGTYQLKGSAEFINFLYNTGIGAKNSQGFGMFDFL